ncbi:MAG: crossover junction endodeoxyribonuclease RuvC [marine bacterium B5-7]|nr:MAG: crossover junction endodeoxyribonuclease RuvC [marine bacterium B5-7]
MKVLGVDPGSRITGLGIVESDGDRLVMHYAASIRAGQGEIGGRLKIIFDAVGDAVERFRPDVVAVEQVFMARNPHSALILGHARGAAIAAAVCRDMPIAEYSAKQIKLAVVGQGGADKGQVQHMVRVLLSLSSNPTVDAADALACAICHINMREVKSRLALNGVVQ